MTEIHTISKQKGKKLLNKLVYLQSLSNRALDFKINAENHTVYVWGEKKKNIFEEKRNLLPVRLEKARTDAAVQNPTAQHSTAPQLPGRGMGALLKLSCTFGTNLNLH